MPYDNGMNNVTDQSENFLFGTKTEPIEIYDSELAKFKLLFSFMVFIVDPVNNTVIYESESFKEKFNIYGLNKIAKVILNQRTALNKTQFDLSLVHEGLRKDYTVSLKPVRFHETDVCFGIIQEIRSSTVSVSTTEKITQIASAFLKIIGSVDIADDISKTLDMILIESIKYFDHGHFGSIFGVQGDQFKIISDLGYGDDIKDFLLPIPQSFLYMATEGKMNRIMLINDIQKNYNLVTLKTVTGESADISSAIVAPLFYRKSLYGMMSIDSTNDHAFNQDDLVVMTFIRDNVQAIISNQLTFLERSNQALTDNMTGLYNRHFLTEYFDSILERSKRYDESFSLVLFDIDNLKVTNDQYGHLVGDHIIKSFSKTLQDNSRRSDVLARYGGDEFIGIYLMSDQAELIKKLEKLERHTTYRLQEKSSIELEVNFSFGIAVYPRDGHTFTELINIADGRMYQAKLVNKLKRKMTHE